MKVLNKLKQTLADWRNDGTDPRKNDVWRVLLFSFNYAGEPLHLPVCKYHYEPGAQFCV